MSRVLDQAFEHPMKQEEEASMLFAGGIMQHGYQCGLIWGAVLAAGAQAIRLYGAGPRAEIAAVKAAQKIVESFRKSNNEINCLEITEIDKSSSTMDMIIYFLIKGGTIGCFRRAARYAPVAFDEIKAALSEEPVRAPSSPVSCAAILANKSGMSDKHTVMLAGFAGGIGLCGGACGALGAALWIRTMENCKDGDIKMDFNDPKATELIEKFIESTGYEFECSEIVGRKFESVEDHAAFIQGGGCSKIIDLLVAECTS